MPPRLHPDRRLTNQEKQARRYARVREQRAYLAALEAAVRDAECNWWDAEYDHARNWRTNHAATIARASRAAGTQATTEE
jgi:Tfp pilus assembly protein PilX